MKLLFTFKYKLPNKIQQICFTNVSKKKMQITSSKSVSKYQKCNFTHFIIPFAFFCFWPQWLCFLLLFLCFVWVFPLQRLPLVRLEIVQQVLYLNQGKKTKSVSHSHCPLLKFPQTIDFPSKIKTTMFPCFFFCSFSLSFFSFLLRKFIELKVKIAARERKGALR